MSGFDDTAKRQVYLSLAVFLYYVLCFALHPQSPFYTHHLSDPDDIMRVNQTVAWLQGQGWYDLSVSRLSPGAGTVVHWSRLIDVPLALLAWPFIASFGVGNAVMMAAFILPLIWLFFLFLLLPTLARGLEKNAHANLAVVFFLFAPLLLFNFSPGRVDHHNVQILIAGFGLLSLTKILRGQRANLYAMGAAFLFACGVWVGAEILPWLILFIAMLAVSGAWFGAAAARAGIIFGLCLPLVTAMIVPVALPISEWSSRALSWFSPAYILFTGLAGLVLIIGGAATLKYKMPTVMRMVVYGVMGVSAAAAFFLLVPSAFHGAFTDYDTFDATTALANITEATPLSAGLTINRFMPSSIIPVLLVLLRFILLPAVAFVYCVVRVYQTRARDRAIWGIYGLFVGASMALTLFWQMRVGVFMELFMLAPLAAMVTSWWRHIEWGLWGRRLFWAEIGVFFLLGPLPVLVVPAIAAHTTFYPDMVLFPAARAAPACRLDNLLSLLNDPRGFGAHPLTIMNDSDSGPELLFATRHHVVAGNFNVPGNADAYAFFHATDDAAAQQAAQKWHANLILFCRHAPSMYVGKDYYNLSHATLKPSADGQVHLVNTDIHQPLIERLIRGQLPIWLKPIEIPDGGDYLLFQIQNAKGTP